MKKFINKAINAKFNTNTNTNTLIQVSEAVTELKKLRYSWAEVLLADLDARLRLELSPSVKTEMIRSWLEMTTADLRAVGIWR